MSIFEQINKKLQQPHIAELVQLLNKYRLELTNDFNANKQMERHKLMQLLLNLQMDVSDHQNAFDLSKLTKQNILNIIKLSRDPPIQRKHAKKYNMKWVKKNQQGKDQKKVGFKNMKKQHPNGQNKGNNKNHQQCNEKNKKQGNSLQIKSKSQPKIADIFRNMKKHQDQQNTVTMKNKPSNNPIAAQPKKNIFFGNQKQKDSKPFNNNNNQAKNQGVNYFGSNNHAKSQSTNNNNNQYGSSSFGNSNNYNVRQNPKPKNQKIQPQKTTTSSWDKPPAVVEFVSANVLPKAVSVRKKFVPPFKKQQTQSIKQADQQNQQDEQKMMDPLYKGLQRKLVETIQSQILQTTKSVKWEQIAGLQFAKKLINQMIVWPMLRPDIFTGMRAPPRGILLFGPPGTGKTMIGRAIASSAHATFFNISASSLTSKWVGQSQKLVRTLFQIARIKQPSVIFIDEIDSLLCSRSEGQQQSSRRVKTQFLVQLDGTKTSQNQRILIIGATNLPQQLDDAVRRRFIKRLYIPLPNTQSRRQLLQTLSHSDTFSVSKQDVNQLSKLTAGFSGADIHALCKQASMIPLREIHSIENIRFSEVPTAKLKHFKQAIKFVRPSVNKKVLAKYEDWNEQYGSYQFNPDELDS